MLGLAAFGLPALSLALPSGYSWGALLLVLLGLTAWPAAVRNLGDWPLELRAWGLTVLAMGLVWAMHLFGGGELPTRTLGLDRMSKYMLVLLALPAMRTAMRWPLALAWGCWVGAAGAGAVALWESVVLHLPRAEGHTNAIHFGNLALLLGVWSLLWAQHPARAAHRPWGWVAAALGLAASILSGSRGGWLALPIFLLLVAWPVAGADSPPASPRRRAAVALALGAGAAALLALPVVNERVVLAVTELADWLATGEANTSVGARLAHWQFAWQLATERPLLGWGQAGYDAQRLHAVALGQVPASLAQLNHAHNEWLDMAAKRGVVGLLALLAFYAVPGWLYARRLKPSASPTTRTLALCGLATVLGYGVFGLTQVMFAHNSGNMMYLFMHTLWLGALAQQKDAADAR